MCSAVSLPDLANGVVVYTAALEFCIACASITEPRSSIGYAPRTLTTPAPSAKS